MAEAKHTPGPWFVVYEPVGDEGDGVTEFPRITGYEPSGDLCHGHEAGPLLPLTEANEALKAAAPELLEHLRFAVKLLRPWAGGTAQVEAMEAAIAKATGETLADSERRLAERGAQS